MLRFFNKPKNITPLLVGMASIVAQATIQVWIANANRDEKKIIPSTSADVKAAASLKK